MSKQLKYFGAEWCTKCEYMKPKVIKYCEENNIELEMIDCTNDETDAKKYDILELPTMLNPDNHKMKSGIFPSEMLDELFKD